MPNTNIPILDDDTVGEIEREPWCHSYGDDRLEAPLESRRVAITVGQRDALCATVRALRADVLTMQAAYDKATSELETENTALREQVAKMREALGVSSTDRERDLESQLEQITKERDEEKRLRAELKQIANAGFDDISSLGTTLKENAVIDFRSRAIALCRDKAVEYRKELEHYERGEEEFAQLNSYAAAADVLARELGQLK